MTEQGRAAGVRVASRVLIAVCVQANGSLLVAFDSDVAPMAIAVPVRSWRSLLDNLPGELFGQMVAGIVDWRVVSAELDDLMEWGTDGKIH